MKYIVMAALAMAAWWAHAQLVFSEPRAMRFVAEHAAKAMSGNGKACDDYSDDVVIDIVSEDPTGRWEVEGGKEEICGYLKQAAAAMTVMQAQSNSRYDNVTIRRGGFPWTRAEVSYTEHTDINMRMMGQAVGTMNAVSEETVTLRRGLSGVMIAGLKSNGVTKMTP
jgi:hypothetical protein